MSRKKPKKNPQRFDSFALADTGNVDKRTNTTIPTEDGVIQAKDFVDENQK